MENYQIGAGRKIKQQLGRYYLFQMNAAHMRWFNGLPGEESKLWTPDENMMEKAVKGDDGYEIVFEVIGTPMADLILAEGENRFVNVPPLVQVGDIVLAKGNVFRIHAQPLVYAGTRDNIVALLKEAKERTDYVA